MADKRKLKCAESFCLHYANGGCGFQWVEQPSPLPRGQMSREYCPQYAEKVGDEIRISMNAYQ